MASNDDNFSYNFIYTCLGCDKRDFRMLKCSRCLIARYCSSECQKNHWKTHKETCNNHDSQLWKNFTEYIKIISTNKYLAPILAATSHYCNHVLKKISYACVMRTKSELTILFKPIDGYETTEHLYLTFYCFKDKKENLSDQNEEAFSYRVEYSTEQIKEYYELVDDYSEKLNLRLFEGLLADPETINRIIITIQDDGKIFIRPSQEKYRKFWSKK